MLQSGELTITLFMNTNLCFLFFRLTNTFHGTLQLLIITSNSNITLMSNTTLGFEISDVCVNFGPCFEHM